VITHLKTAIFFVVCLVVGVGIGKGYLWLRQPPKRGFEHSDGPPVITGVGDAPALRGFAVRANALPPDTLLRQWQDAFATAVGIEYDNTLTADQLAAAAKSAHAHNLQVVLLPPGLGRGSAQQSPFPVSLPAAAAFAQNAGVDVLCASNFTREPDAAFWSPAIAEVRAVFKGKIMLAARPDVVYRVDCWDLADYIGVIGPLPLPQRLPSAPDTVTLHDLRVGWDCTLTSLETLATVNAKKLALLNMDVPLEVSARLPSTAASNVAPAKNPDLQRQIYEALLLETKGRAEKTAMLLFTWGSPDPAEAPNNLTGLMAKITEAWDPQKPRPPETLPAPTPDEEDIMEPEAQTEGNGTDPAATAH
jgi:hypothetical protein